MAENPRVKIVSKDLQGQTFELSRQEHTLGRLEECDICIPNSAVSSRHCIMTKEEDGDYLLSDLNSTNGTIVNGKAVDEVKLEHSDIIRIGAVEIIYESPIRKGRKKPNMPSDDSRKRIDLQTTLGSTAVAESPNFSPFPSKDPVIDRGTGRLSLVIGLTVVGVLSLAALAALIYVIANLL